MQLKKCAFDANEFDSHSSSRYKFVWEVYSFMNKDLMTTVIDNIVEFTTLLMN